MVTDGVTLEDLPNPERYIRFYHDTLLHSQAGYSNALAMTLRLMELDYKAFAGDILDETDEELPT